MVWSLRNMFPRFQKPQQSNVADTLQRYAEKNAADALIIDAKTDKLLLALKQAGIEATRRTIGAEPPSYPGDYPVTARSIVGFTDAVGFSHKVSVYAFEDKDGNDVFHERSYERDITFTLTPVTPETLLENPDLAIDGLRRIGLREDLQDDVPADVAASILINIGAEKPEALPAMLKVTITDPVYKSDVRAEMLIPSDAACYIRGAGNPKTFVLDHTMADDRIVFSVQPADSIRNEEGLVDVTPIDGIEYTRPGALQLNHIGNRIHIAIPRTAFAGDNLPPAAGTAKNFGNSPFSPEFMAHGWKPLADVIGEVYGNAASSKPDLRLS